MALSREFRRAPLKPKIFTLSTCAMGKKCTHKMSVNVFGWGTPSSKRLCLCSRRNASKGVKDQQNSRFLIHSSVHQKVFGGYLMRLAYEVRQFHKLTNALILTSSKLGIASVSLFTRGSVNFLSLDSISFSRPVPIGSILRLRSQILHTRSSPECRTLVVSVSSPARLYTLGA